MRFLNLGPVLALLAAPLASLAGAAHQDPPVPEPPVQEPPVEEPPVQEPPAEDEAGRDEPAPPPVVVVRTKVDELAEQLLAAQGGPEVLGAFQSLQFVVTPVSFRPVPRAPGSDAPPQYEELRGEPQTFASTFRGLERKMRLDEVTTIDGREVTKTKILVARETTSDVVFMLNGAKRNVIREVRDQIIQDLTTLAGQFDVLLGLAGGQLRGSYAGPAERAGVRYETVTATFASGVNPDQVYRLYIDPQTHLVARYDLFDANSRRLRLRVLVDGYAEHGGLELPTALTFRNRQDEPLMRWEFSEVAVNAPIEPERFEP